MTDESAVLLGQILTFVVLVLAVAAIIGSIIVISTIVKRRKK